MEYWAHVQAFMPVELWPAMRFRRDHFRDVRGKWWNNVSDEAAAELVARIADAGRPMTARDLDDGAPRSKEHWGWNWSEARRGLDMLYSCGDLAIAGRNGQFEVALRPPRAGAARPRARDAGPDTAPSSTWRWSGGPRSPTGSRPLRCLKDYFRMRVDQVRPAVDLLVESGELEPVTIEGWKRPAYLHRDARRPRAVPARALLSPFDPVVWERERTEQLFDFHYRIEIYTPREKRIHGYYVLPFLLRDEIVGRVDLKARPVHRSAAGQGLLRRGRGTRRRRARAGCRAAPAGRLAGSGRRASSSRGATWHARRRPVGALAGTEAAGPCSERLAARSSEERRTWPAR